MPRKHKPAFTDVVLPIFDQPDEVKQYRTKADDDRKTKVGWHRYKSPNPVTCEDCLTELKDGERKGVSVASYKRLHGDQVRFLCFQHTQVQRHRDQLEGISRDAD